MVWPSAPAADFAEAGREGLLKINPASEFKLSYQTAQGRKIIRRGQVNRYLEEAEKLGAYPYDTDKRSTALHAKTVDLADAKASPCSTFRAPKESAEFGGVP